MSAKQRIGLIGVGLMGHGIGKTMGRVEWKRFIVKTLLVNQIPNRPS